MITLIVVGRLLMAALILGIFAAALWHFRTHGPRLFPRPAEIRDRQRESDDARKRYENVQRAMILLKATRKA